jgi:hypothetical protein
VERSEAEAIYAAGRKPVVEALVALSARLEAQDAQLAALSERFAQLVAAAKPRSAVAWEARPLARDGPQAGRSTGTCWAWARVVSDRAGG